MTPIRARATILAFFSVLWLACAGTWLGWGQFTPADEFRAFSPWPRAGPGFFNGLNLYIHDHFGFRGWFVTLNGLLRAKLFRTSTSPNVIIGKQGFLFYAGDGSLEGYMGTNPMPDCELESWVLLF